MFDIPLVIHICTLNTVFVFYYYYYYYLSVYNYAKV